MALPVLTAPEFFTELPSNKQKVKYRPFTVKEQKVLLIAVESSEEEDILNATQTIVKNCTDVQDPTKLPSFDLEWLFLHIRGKSIGEDFEFRMRHGSDDECKHITDVSFSLDDITFDLPEGHSNKVMVNDQIGIVLQYPNIVTIKDFSSAISDPLKMINFISSNIEMIFDNDNVYDNFSQEEVTNFVENLSTTQYENILQWYKNLPVLTHKIEWTCSECNKQEAVVLRGLNDFFT